MVNYINYLISHWDFSLILAFMIARIILNFEKKKLSMFFVAVYAVFIVWLLLNIPLFTTFFILFLTIDSMIGTYLATMMKKFDKVYFLTMLVNFVIIILLIQNFTGAFMP